MLNPRLSQRYAKSLLDLSLERNQLEEVYADIQWLQAVCRSNRDFVNLLRSPVIKADIKKRIFAAVTEGNLGELTRAFSNLLMQKGRESFLPEITQAFIDGYKVYRQIQVVKLTTASPASESLKSVIVEKVKKQGGYREVELQEIVKPELIGGFVLQMGDKMVDASVAYDLRNVARQFERNDFIYKIR